MAVLLLVQLSKAYMHVVLVSHPKVHFLFHDLHCKLLMPIICSRLPGLVVGSCMPGHYPLALTISQTRLLARRCCYAPNDPSVQLKDELFHYYRLLLYWTEMEASLSLTTT